jgi:SAM-dependent methyltransferase
MLDTASTESSRPALATFEAMAPWYDRFTFDHDFVRWTGYLEAVAKDHGLEGNRLLDVACGTGKSFEMFATRGYEIVGVDLSPAMAALAEARDPSATILVADVRRLPKIGTFDLALCLGDALNYMVEPADLDRALTRIGCNLRPGAVLIFDLNSLKTYRDVFGADRCIDRDDVFVAWCGQTRDEPEPGMLAESAIHAFLPTPGGTWTRATSLHRQRHHPERTLRRALKRAGFDRVWVYGMRPDGAPDGAFDEWRHHKSLFVARRAGDSSRTEGR